MVLESRNGLVDPKLRPSPPRKCSADPALDDRRFCFPARVFRFILASAASCLSSMLSRARKSGCELRSRWVSFMPRVFAKSSSLSCLPRLPNRHPASPLDLENRPRNRPLRGGEPSRPELPDLPASLTLMDPSKNCEFPRSRFTLGEGLRTTNFLTRPPMFFKLCPNVALNFSDRGVGPMESRLKVYGLFSRSPKPFSGPPSGVRRVLLRFRRSLLRTNQKINAAMATNATPPSTPPTTALVTCVLGPVLVTAASESASASAVWLAAGLAVNTTLPLVVTTAALPALRPLPVARS